MRTVLVTVMQNFLFLPHRWPKPLPVLIVPTHGGMARLSWPRWLVTHLGGLPAQKTITHPSIDWAGCKVTSLIETNMLPLNHATTYMHTGCHKKNWGIAHRESKICHYTPASNCVKCRTILKKFFVLRHTTQPFYGPFSGTTPVSRCQKISSFFYIFMVQGKISEADTPTIWLGATPSRLISDSPPSSPQFLCWIPFLLQHSHFILAWDRHQIWWLAYQ